MDTFFDSSDSLSLLSSGDLSESTPSEESNALFGQEGDDNFNGGEGNDTLFGGGGRDSLFGGRGRDSLDGGQDHDFLVGGAHDDTLVGGAGHDTMLGQSNMDYLYGGAGHDQLKGGDGNDTLSGADGLDSLYGGAGFDQFEVWRSGWDNQNIIADYEDGQDKIAIHDGQISGFENLSITQTGSSVTIQDANDSNIYYATVNDILASDLTASDFLFAAS
ncbi:putative calcium-binding protein [Xenococcus sp. PCC 7305]|uniref:calcium-binding protein n=1 Tax=Xenococcus sp. PCC 7305 TaxID=102125 RepID=UPI0002AC433A|nr:calcium-binding protein [Xenococcus sp. PCC 7305]ELS02583.1 putative calcium-binding protein [Xenococcus sp. PCC 7305]